MSKEALKVEVLEKAEAPSCGSFWGGVAVGVAAGIGAGIIIT